MLAIIDYGMGNLRSVEKAFQKCGAKTLVTSDAKKINKADKIVFPGVGAFPKCMEKLSDLNLIDVIKENAAEKPFLGICLGLQALFTTGFEGKKTKGLDIIKGKVIKFKKGLKIPHMGWNQVSFKEKSPLFKGIPQNTYFYFVHSYYVVPEDEKIISGKTEYGIKFASAVQKNNVFGLQFHPEKSQDAGLTILENFIRI